MINFSKTPLLERHIYQEVRQILAFETRTDLGEGSQPNNYSTDT